MKRHQTRIPYLVLSGLLLMLSPFILWAGGDDRPQVKAASSIGEDHVLLAPTSNLPVFVPEGRLTEEFVAELRSSNEGPFNYFAGALSVAQDAQEAGHVPQCEFVAGDTGGPPNRSGPTILDYVAAAPIAVVAEVINIVPGWSGKSVGTMVYARVLEILACNETRTQRRIEVGDIVSTSVAVGRIEVEGLTLCDETEQAIKLPDPGSKVVFTGLPTPSDAYFLGGSQPFFLLDGDRLEPQRYNRIRFEAGSLGDISTRGQFEACGGAG